jgi:nicotinamide-nucleotide amidase
MLRRAAILSIGDELALGQNVDTNSQWLAAELAARAVHTIEHRTVADDRAAIAAAVRELAARVDALVLTGGLGPTEDDLTRAALADALGEELVPDEAALEWIEANFAARRITMPASNRLQAMRPRSMQCVPNPHGTAPGLVGTLERCVIAALPGPPREMQPMFRERIAPRLPVDEGTDVLLTTTVHELGLGEAAAAERLGELVARDRTPLVGTTVRDMIVSARIRAAGPAEAMRAAIDGEVAEIERRWHPYVFGRDEATLAGAVGTLLARAGKKLVTAESCTGGWLGKMIVDEPGASGHYVGGWITYENALKTSALDVSSTLLSACGAVSREVAEAMASGAMAHADADFALAITGLAGPEGGSAEKPLGTVFVALASREQNGIDFVTRRFRFPGGRSVIRERSALAALQMLRFALLGVAPDTPMLFETLPVETPAAPRA